MSKYRIHQRGFKWLVQEKKWYGWRTLSFWYAIKNARIVKKHLEDEEAKS